MAEGHRRAAVRVLLLMGSPYSQAAEAVEVPRPPGKPFPVLESSTSPAGADIEGTPGGCNCFREKRYIEVYLVD